MNTIHQEYQNKEKPLSEEQAILQAILQAKYIAFVLSGEAEPDFEPELYLGEETVIV